MRSDHRRFFDNGFRRGIRERGQLPLTQNAVCMKTEVYCPIRMKVNDCNLSCFQEKLRGLESRLTWHLTFSQRYPTRVVHRKIDMSNASATSKLYSLPNLARTHR